MVEHTRKELKNDRYERHDHEFGPVFDGESEILVLGSFPSVKSREHQFYYGHPQNRFWKVMAAVFSCPVPETIEEKKAMLLEHHVAVWDVIESCEIIGSSDASIRDVVPTNIGWLLLQTKVRTIYANGATAARLYEKYQKMQTGREIVRLPSTSPANAAWSVEKLVDAWKCIRREGRL
jgi:hypoxanthine-DNA glycosylase